MEIVNRIKIHQLEPELRLRFLEPPKRERCAVVSKGVISLTLHCLSFLQIFIDSDALLTYDGRNYKQLVLVNRIKILSIKTRVTIVFLITTDTGMMRCCKHGRYFFNFVLPVISPNTH